jgi:hypothetical protein
VRILKTNPKFVQEYLLNHDKFPEQWSNKKTQQYIRTAEFSLASQLIMLKEMHPVIHLAIPIAFFIVDLLLFAVLLNQLFP